MKVTRVQKITAFCSSRMTNMSWALVFALTVSLVAVSGTLHAQTSKEVQNPRVILPLNQGWYKGKVADYILTEASDKALAEQLDVNYVAALANTISAGAVDDIYNVTNFSQGRVIASAPIPAGSGNTDPNYTPLWQLNLVTWNTGIIPHLLTSEEEILMARDQGLLTIVKTDIVLNCPVIYTPFGGLFPKAHIIGASKVQAGSS